MHCIPLGLLVRPASYCHTQMNRWHGTESGQPCISRPATLTESRWPGRKWVATKVGQCTKWGHWGAICSSTNTAQASIRARHPRPCSRVLVSDEGLMLQSQHTGKSHQRDFMAVGKVTLWEDYRLPTPVSSSIPESRSDIYPPLPHTSRHLEEMGIHWALLQHEISSSWDPETV